MATGGDGAAGLPRPNCFKVDRPGDSPARKKVARLLTGANPPVVLVLLSTRGASQRSAKLIIASTPPAAVRKQPGSSDFATNRAADSDERGERLPCTRVAGPGIDREPGRTLGWRGRRLCSFPIRSIALKYTHQAASVPSGTDVAGWRGQERMGLDGGPSPTGPVREAGVGWSAAGLCLAGGGPTA